MSTIQTSLHLGSFADAVTDESAEWGPVTRTVAAAGYLLAVGIVFTGVTGAVLYLLG